jgi:hypothetical protein
VVNPGLMEFQNPDDARAFIKTLAEEDTSL